MKYLKFFKHSCLPKVFNVFSSQTKLIQNLFFRIETQRLINKILGIKIYIVKDLLK